MSHQMSHEEAVGRAVLALQDARERKRAAEQRAFDEARSQEEFEADMASFRAAREDIEAARAELRRLGVKISLLH